MIVWPKDKKPHSTLVVGDMHNKQPLILPRIDAAIEAFEPDQIVFLGDYVDEWGSEDADVIAGLRQLTWWAKSGTHASVPKTFLLGNHDFYYLMNEPLSGTHMNVRDEVCELLPSLEPQLATEVDTFLLTHAGVTESWLTRNLTCRRTAAEIAHWLNEMYKSGDELVWDVLAWCGPARGGWEDPGPLWADRHELVDDPAKGIRQVVGHSPVTTCAHSTEIADHCKEDIWFCDTLSFMRNGAPVGDGSFLLIEDGKARSIDLAEEIGLESWLAKSWIY